VRKFVDTQERTVLCQKCCNESALRYEGTFCMLIETYLFASLKHATLLLATVRLGYNVMTGTLCRYNRGV
jgi:hypothetical protein